MSKYPQKQTTVAPAKEVTSVEQTNNVVQGATDNNVVGDGIDPAIVGAAPAATEQSDSGASQSDDAGANVGSEDTSAIGSGTEKPAAPSVDPEPAPAPTPAPAAPVAPVPEPKPVPVVEIKAVPVVEVKVAAEEDTGPFYANKGLSRSSESMLVRVQEYIDKMDPKRPMDHQTGVPYQKSLYRALIWAVNGVVDEDFRKVFSLLLAQFAKHANGVFHESAVNRFPEHITLSPEERKTFFGLTNLMVIAGDVKGRDLRMKQLDFNRMFTQEITEQGRQRLLGFFNK